MTIATIFTGMICSILCESRPNHEYRVLPAHSQCYSQRWPRCQCLVVARTLPYVERPSVSSICVVDAPICSQNCHLRVSCQPCCRTLDRRSKLRLQLVHPPCARLRRSKSAHPRRRSLVRRRVSNGHSPIIFAERLLVCPISREVEYSISFVPRSHSPSPSPLPSFLFSSRGPRTRRITEIISCTRSASPSAHKLRSSHRSDVRREPRTGMSVPLALPDFDGCSSCFPEFLECLPFPLPTTPHSPQVDDSTWPNSNETKSSAMCARSFHSPRGLLSIVSGKSIVEIAFAGNRVRK